MSDYTWAMGLADTCEKFQDKKEDDVLQKLQMNFLEKMKKQYQYNI